MRCRPSSVRAVRSMRSRGLLTVKNRRNNHGSCELIVIRLKELVQQYGQQRVESATANLCTFDGQFTVKPPPLAQVQLRSNVRPLCWGILGAPPEHPWHELMKRPEPLPPPWDMEMDGKPKQLVPQEQSLAPQPEKAPKKRTRKRAS